MKLKTRLGIMVSGVLMSLYGDLLMHRGQWVYQNHFSMTMYAPAVIGTGIVFGLVGCLPPASLFRRSGNKVKTVRSSPRSSTKTESGESRDTSSSSFGAASRSLGALHVRWLTKISRKQLTFSPRRQAEKLTIPQILYPARLFAAAVQLCAEFRVLSR